MPTTLSAAVNRNGIQALNALSAALLVCLVVLQLYKWGVMRKVFALIVPEVLLNGWVLFCLAMAAFAAISVSVSKTGRERPDMWIVITLGVNVVTFLVACGRGGYYQLFG